MTIDHTARYWAYANPLAEFMSTPWGTAATQTAFDRWTAIESGL